VHVRLFWKALAVQALLMALLFGVLVALPLPEGFFEDYGFATGPLAWILCSVGTARVLSLPGGVAGVLVLLATTHLAAMAAALLVFSASCGSYEPDAEAATAGARRQ
jgi:hypothetical protein